MKRHTTEGGKATGTQAVFRAFALLRAFGDATPEWGLAELSRQLGLTRTTALRLLSALEREGMVARSKQGGPYRLGSGAIELGALAQRSNSLHRAARAELEDLTRLTGETSSLEILAGSEVLVLDEIQGHHKLSPAPTIGARWPAHAASTGKVLLAAAARSGNGAVSRFPARLPRLTPNTITSPARMAAELEKVAKRGYATALEELEAGYSAVGAPVRNHEGLVVAAISVGGPSVRFTSKRLTALSRQVCEAADRISQRLGSRGAPARSP